MGVLLLIIIVVAVGYFVSLRLWPFTYCRACGGTRRKAGSNSKRFGPCRRCNGTGRQTRLGARFTKAR